MEHEQNPPTPIRTDNSTSAIYVNKNMQMRHSKAWDMQLHWLRDKENKEFFNVFWDRGPNNGADYFTKHHPIVHHRRIRMTRKYIRDVHKDLKKTINLIYLKCETAHISERVC